MFSESVSTIIFAYGVIIAKLVVDQDLAVSDRFHFKTIDSPFQPCSILFLH